MTDPLHITFACLVLSAAFGLSLFVIAIGFVVAVDHWRVVAHACSIRRADDHALRAVGASAGELLQ